MQVTRPLGYNSHLKLTIARYYTPSGRCIQALDYSHRNADKSVSKFADSLKIQFKTKNGRAVFSAGGVEPDVKLQEPAISAIEANIITKNYLFDYATDYVRKHPTIADAALFSLTDGEMNDFIKWMANKDYAYKSNLEIELDSLKNMAIKENKYSEAKKEFDALRQKLAHDKKEELLKYKEHIRQSLENEIVSRYFYNKGRAVNGLRYDAYFDKAVYLLTHNAEYSRLLK